MLRKINLIVKLLFLQLSARSQNVPFEKINFSNPLQSEIDSIIHEQVKAFFKKTKAPGLIIGISKNGEKKFYSYGVADSVSKQSFSPQTVFEIGSITKTFTANLLFQLEQQKIVNINNSIVSYLPTQFKNDSILEKITLVSLAIQSSGLPRLPDNFDKIKEYTLMQPYQFYKREHLYSFLKSIRKNNPGSYAYSNLGFGLLSTIIENATAMSFESLLNNAIFQPLQMDDTYIGSKKKASDSATGYFYGNPAAYWEFDCLAGAGAIKSTATDILKYLDAHIETNIENFSLAARLVTQPVKSISPNMQICYGWHTLEDLKHRVFWHNGGTYGFCSFAAFEPSTKTSLVLAANAFNINPALDKLATDILILLMGGDAEQ